MQLTTTLALASGVIPSPISGAVLDSRIPAEVQPRGGSNFSCPPATPSYCGWFNAGNGTPPQCIAPHPIPDCMPEPECASGQVAYCARDPATFCPYAADNDYCQDDGLGITICVDVEAVVDEVVKLLAETFCVVDTAIEKLGSHACAGPALAPLTWPPWILDAPSQSSLIS